MRVSPMRGVPEGLTGRRPAQTFDFEMSKWRFISGKVELALAMIASARAMAGVVS